MSPGTEEVRLPRRTLLALGALAALAGTGGLAGCAAEDDDLVAADVARRPGDAARVPGLVDAVGAFGADLLAALGGEGNLVCSPWSVLVALAMVRHGARGTTAAEMDAALHLPDLAALGPGLSALDQLLARRAGRRENAGSEKATVVLATANRVWGQRPHGVGAAVPRGPRRPGSAPACPRPTSPAAPRRLGARSTPGSRTRPTTGSPS